MKKFGKVMRAIAGVLCAVMAFVCTLGFVVGNIGFGIVAQPLTMVLGAKDYTVENPAEQAAYPSDYDSADAQLAAAADVSRQIESEGLVLLENNGSALPLAGGARVSVFGQDSVDFLYGGSGSGSVDASTSHTLRQALEQAGLVVNPMLWDFYATGAGAGYRKVVPDVTGAGGFAPNEVPQDAYTDEVRASYADYSDAAVVVIGRTGSESTDLPEGYLELTAEERAMVGVACADFKRTILVLNTANPMQIESARELGVDAVLWVGMPGQAGIDAVGDVLAGAVNPSGSLVDTYAFDASTAPSSANFGDYSIVNSDVESGNKYLSYSEGIYVGYRYYETRYEDAVLGQGNAGDFNYASEVLYPFGHGLSYTDFAWSGYAVEQTDDGYRATVTVTNSGKVSGRDVVQLYLQQPYTDYDRANGIEKSAVQLVGFAKTCLLKPGESQTVTVDVSREELRCYDAAGAGTYVLEPGTYLLTAASDAHEAINNVLAAKGKTVADGMDAGGDAGLVWAAQVEGELDDVSFSTSAATGQKIENQFADADLRTWDAGFAYLSRSDWQGTWPTTYAGGSWTAPADFIDGLRVSSSEDADAVMPDFGVTSEKFGRLALAELAGADFDDPRWDALLSQMSKQEMWDLVRRSGYLSMAIPNIGMPQVTLKDGPAGISGTLTGGGVACMSYPAEIVIASTWNVELAERMGQMVGEDSIASGVAVWYAPSMNIHRNALSGRNFEYYSEDGFASGKMAAAVVRGAQSKGCVVTVKHYALNDQETNRYGASIMANEQAIREVYLRPFEICVREGNPGGLMIAMNRVGSKWVGANYGLMTGTLRNEWGFSGFATTDQATFPTFNYCDIEQGLEAGTDMWLNAAELMGNSDPSGLSASTMQRACTAAHRILYVYANSNAMNGIAADSVIVPAALPTWQLVRIAGSVLLVLFGWVWFKLFHLCFGTRTLWQVFRKKPKRAGLRY